MTIRERLLATLYWNEPDQVPLTVYDWMLNRGMRERHVRNLGVGLIYRPAPYHVEYRNVDVTHTEYWEQGKRLIRNTFSTPVGDIWEILEPDVTGYYNVNSWIKAFLIKTPDDYRVMEYIWKHLVFHDNASRIQTLIRQVGEDGLVYSRIAKSPIQEILYRMVGLERFSFDCYDHPDLLESLHDLMLRRYEEIYEFAVAAPVEILVLGDNITSEVVGKARYRKYLKPVYHRIHELLRGTDKKLAVHMDGNLHS
ncbi:hypothetical protein GF339_14140, partial [candidate division KSB3 bacterium]|nr:hypothetical protein [candidate division KSB3 bacterium]MBD3325722.1 hypothetical protein [candidate division KSB3 bacterium]